METLSLRLVSGLELLGTHAAQMTMTAGPIVERVEIVGDIGQRQHSVLVNLLLDPFLLLQAAKKGLDHGVVSAVALASKRRFTNAMDYILRLQRSATFLTVAVSLWFMVRLWREAELYGAQEVIFGVWFVVAITIQLLAGSPGVWITGLLAQLALAIVLVLKDQIDNIY